MIEKLPPSVAKAATGAAPVLALASWAEWIDWGIRVGAGLAAIVASICAAWYWISKKRREDRYSDNESGL